MRFSTVIAAAAFIGATFASPIQEFEKRAGTGRVITRCTTANTVALTFDDGPYNYIYDIVNTLNAAGAKGTFFWNGNNYGCIYSTTNVDRIKYAYNNGHQVASHTWSHKDLTTLNWDQIHNEMWKVEEALIKVLGVRPAFMRPPYGNYNSLVTDASRVRLQDLVIWDLDTGDSVGQSPSYSKQQYDSRISQRPSTILSLAHETYSSSAYDVLPYAIQKLKAAGYRLVTVAECVGAQPYSEFHTPQARDSTWKC